MGRLENRHPSQCVLTQLVTLFAGRSLQELDGLHDNGANLRALWIVGVGRVAEGENDRERDTQELEQFHRFIPVRDRAGTAGQVVLNSGLLASEEQMCGGIEIGPKWLPPRRRET